MGDRAGFVARVKDGVRASDLKTDLEANWGGRGLFAYDNLGLVVGIIKSSYPEGCMVNLIKNEMIEEFASLSEKGNTASDYWSLLG
jgi:hypothetical protein